MEQQTIDNIARKKADKRAETSKKNIEKARLIRSEKQKRAKEEIKEFTKKTKQKYAKGKPISKVSDLVAESRKELEREYYEKYNPSKKRDTESENESYESESDSSDSDLEQLVITKGTKKKVKKSNPKRKKRETVGTSRETEYLRSEIDQLKSFVSKFNQEASGLHAKKTRKRRERKSPMVTIVNPAPQYTQNPPKVNDALAEQIQKKILLNF
jgi:hypothetical protein